MVLFPDEVDLKPIEILSHSPLYLFSADGEEKLADFLEDSVGDVVRPNQFV